MNDEAISYFQRAFARLDGSSMGECHKEWQLEALKGLGQIYLGIGKVLEAETCFRQAIALGKEMGLPAPELVRLYYWLARAMFWQSRYDEIMRLGEEVLALLGDEAASVEAVLMNQIVGAYSRRSNMERAREFAYRNAELIPHLPYTEEFRSAYSGLIELYAFFDKNVEEALRWSKALEREATKHHDLRGLAEAHRFTARMRGFGEQRGNSMGESKH